MLHAYIFLEITAVGFKIGNVVDGVNWRKVGDDRIELEMQKQQNIKQI